MQNKIVINHIPKTYLFFHVSADLASPHVVRIGGAFTVNRATPLCVILSEQAGTGWRSMAPGRNKLGG